MNSLDKIDVSLHEMKHYYLSVYVFGLTNYVEVYLKTEFKVDTSCDFGNIINGDLKNKLR